MGCLLGTVYPSSAQPDKGGSSGGGGSSDSYGDVIPVPEKVEPSRSEGHKPPPPAPVTKRCVVPNEVKERLHYLHNYSRIICANPGLVLSGKCVQTMQDFKNLYDKHCGSPPPNKLPPERKAKAQGVPAPSAPQVAEQETPAPTTIQRPPKPYRIRMQLQHGSDDKDVVPAEVVESDNPITVAEGNAAIDRLQKESPGLVERACRKAYQKMKNTIAKYPPKGVDDLGHIVDKSCDSHPKYKRGLRVDFENTAGKNFTE